MTNNDKLKAIQEYVNTYEANARGALRATTFSAAWLHMKGKLEAAEKINAVINDIISQDK